VWWVELASIDDSANIAAAIGTAIGVPEVTDSLDGLVVAVRDGQVLLVVDNCEHLVADVAVIVHRLLASCPNLRILTTSRASLDVPGEVTWRIPPLSLPDCATPVAVESLLQFDAVRLFVDRSTRIRPNFRLSDDNGPAIAEICQRLDGIPLAIELAAARSRTLHANQILIALADAFPFLTGGARTVLPRQQTLEASIAWSHGLLSEPERVVLRRLAIFAGSFSLDGAEAIVAGGGIDRGDVLELLDRLVGQSLLQVDDDTDESRYRLLETVRQYATHQVQAVHEHDVVGDRHAAFYVRLAADLGSRVYGAEMVAAITALERDQDNIRAALERRAADGRWDDFGAVLWPLHLYWRNVGRNAEAIRWLTRFLDSPSSDERLRARVLHARGQALVWAGDFVASLRDLNDSLTLATTIGDDFAAGHAREALGIPLSVVDPVSAVRILDEAVEQLRGVDDYGLCNGQLAKATALITRGMADDAEQMLDAAEPLAVAMGQPMNLSFMHVLRGYVAVTRGETDEVGVRLARARALLDGPMAFTLRGELENLAVLLAVYRDEASARLEMLPKLLREAVEAGRGYEAMWLSLNLGLRAIARRELDEALVLLDDLAAQAEAMSFTIIAAQARVWSADVAQATGDLDGAKRRIEQGRPVFDLLDSPQVEACITRRRAALALAARDIGGADKLIHESIALEAEHRYRFELVNSLDVLTHIEATREDWTEAVRTHGIAQQLRDDYTLRLRLEPERSHVDADVKKARDVLGAETFTALFAEGRSLSMDEGVAYVQRARGERKRPAHGWAALTPTERQVADLIGEGLSNPQIAARLFVARETVKTHVSHILTKLRFTSRTQLAAEVTQRRVQRDPTG
jgi:predicted ATPase/DNA-binding CsgD family transcriptional regulator